MRIGSSESYRTTLSDLLKIQYEQYGLSNDITSGQKVNVPSDAAGYASTILDSRVSLLSVQQYRYNLEATSAWLSASESAMDSILDALNRASVLAEQMATGTYDEDQREAAATELEDILAEIVTLANTQSEGYYVFAGSKNDQAAITAGLTASERAELLTDPTSGHGTLAQAVLASAGDYRLCLTRNASGAGNTITIAAGNTLGASLGLIDFNSFSHTSFADDDSADAYTTTSGVASAATAISNQVGEHFSFTAAAAAGLQTYRTEARLTVTGANTVQIGGDTYANADAADLVEQINSAAGLDYFAILENGNQVRIVGKGTGAAFDISEVGASGNLAIDADTSLSDVATALGEGVRASGVLHLDGADAAFPPAATDTVSIGSYTYTWGEIVGDATPATAADYASLLADFVNANSEEVAATVTSSGTGASIQLTARAAGNDGNLTLASSNAALATSGALYGGVDGSDTATDGRLYATGTATTLRRATDLTATVLAVEGDDVTIRVRWYDDDGTLHSQDVSLGAAGEDNAVAVPGLGEFSLYRDDQTFTAGAVFQISLDHYQGDDEILSVNFSSGTRMAYSWTAEDLLGTANKVDLLGKTAQPRENAGSGQIHLAGAYTGLDDRDLSFTVIEGGQVPSDSVTLRVTWVDDSGQSQSQDVTVTGAGLGNAVSIPGCDGVALYLDSGDLQAGDSFSYSIEQGTVSVLDTLNEWYYQLTNGTLEEAQTASQEALEALGLATQNVTDLLAQAGSREDRCTARTAVLDSEEFYHESMVDDLQSVDLTQAYLDLTAAQTAYNASLQTISQTQDLFLLNYL